jgi:DNA invertase Pin-like site-specific DNA recombinase
MQSSNIREQQRSRIPLPKQAVIFARSRIVPYDEVREFAQFKAQVWACREVADGLGAAVASVYEACGGASNPGVRQAVEQLLDEVDRGGIDYVITQSFDRLARRPGELARIVERIVAAGARLVTTADPREAFLQDVSLFCLIAKTNERRAS